MHNAIPILILLLSFFLPYPAAAARCITDDAGERLCLDAPATRIIPLYGAFTDILTDMGLTDRIVGRTHSDIGPDGMLPPEIPNIGSHMRPNVEMVLALQPQLVLQMGSRADSAQSVQALRKQGVPAAFFEVSTIAGVFSVIDRLGILLDAEKEARRLNASLASRLAVLQTRLDAAPARATPRVFFEVRYPNLLGAGPDSIVSDIIRAAGGHNVLATENPQRSGRLVRLGEEELLRLNPDVYCVQTGPMNKNPTPPTERTHFAPLEAVKNGNVFLVDERLFSRPGSRVLDAVEQLAYLLHPTIFPQQELP